MVFVILPSANLPSAPLPATPVPTSARPHHHRPPRRQTARPQSAPTTSAAVVSRLRLDMIILKTSCSHVLYYSIYIIFIIVISYYWLLRSSRLFRTEPPDLSVWLWCREVHWTQRPHWFLERSWFFFCFAITRLYVDLHCWIWILVTAAIQNSNHLCG